MVDSATTARKRRLSSMFSGTIPDAFMGKKMLNLFCKKTKKLIDFVQSFLIFSIQDLSCKVTLSLQNTFNFYTLAFQFRFQARREFQI